MKKFDLVIFDLDGTLFDTKNSIISSVCIAAKNLGYRDLSEEDKKVFLGPPLDYSVPIVFKTNVEDTKRIIDEYRKVYFETEMYKTKLYDGILDLLNKLKENNYKIALSTYKNQKCLKNLFDYFNITKYFDCLNGTLEHEDDKTNILRRSMQMTDCNDPEKVVMIGDTEHDLKAARKIGCYFVGMTYGFGYKDLSEEDTNYNKTLCYLDNANNIFQNLEKN